MSKLNKNWEKLQNLLKEDDASLAAAVGGFKGYHKTLEEICSRPIGTKSISGLCTMFLELKEAFELPRKYRKFGDRTLDDISPGLTGRLRLIRELEQENYDTFLYTIENISSQWEKAKKQFRRWKPEYGIEELARQRLGLDSVANLYGQLLSGFGGSLGTHEIDELDRYLSFIRDIAPLDAGLEAFSRSYNSKRNFTAEKLNVLMRDLSDIRKGYLKAGNSHRPLIERIFSKDSIFLYREGLYGADTLMDELLARREQLQARYSSMHQQSREEILPAKPAPPNADQTQETREKTLPIEDDPSPLLISPLPDLPTCSPDTQTPYRPIVRNQTNRFDLATYLLVIGYPSLRYMKLMDILLGKTGIRHPIERLASFAESLEKLPPANSVSDMDYLYHLEHAIREDMNHGSIDPLIANNSQYWEQAHSALTRLGQYIQNSEASLGLDASRIKDHLPVTGPENQYNLVLA